MNNTFGRPIIPENEELRIKALTYYNLLNNLPDGYFNNLAQIIATTFDTPIALISIVKEDLVFFKGNAGMENVIEVDRGESICSLAILNPEPTVFKDALNEPCLLSNPNVVGDFGLRFYAGAPISTKEGLNLGTVCIIDKYPREFSKNEKEMLIKFAENAMQEIEWRKEVQIMPVE